LLVFDFACVFCCSTPHQPCEFHREDHGNGRQRQNLEPHHTTPSNNGVIKHIDSHRQRHPGERRGTETVLAIQQMAMGELPNCIDRTAELTGAITVIVGRRRRRAGRNRPRIGRASLAYALFRRAGIQARPGMGRINGAASAPYWRSRSRAVDHGQPAHSRSYKGRPAGWNRVGGGLGDEAATAMASLHCREKSDGFTRRHFCYHRHFMGFFPAQAAPF
jgi:hypothetical protein